MTWYFTRCTCLPEGAAESLPTSCSVTRPSERSKLKHIPEGCCLSDSWPEHCRRFRFGMTSEHSAWTIRRCNRSSNTAGQFMNGLLSQAVSLAPIFPAPAKAKGLKAKIPACGSRCTALLAKYAPGTSLWKTAHPLFREDLDEFSAAFPSWGTMRSGELSLLPMPSFIIMLREQINKWRKDGTIRRLALWGRADTKTISGPRPVTSENDFGSSPPILVWPTPTATDAKNRNNPSQLRRHSPGLSALLPCPVSRDWVTWFMGWPLDNTDDWIERTLTGRWWTREPSKIAQKQRYDVEHLKALGNGQVPLAAAIAWSVLSSLVVTGNPTRDLP